MAFGQKNIHTKVKIHPGAGRMPASWGSRFTHSLCFH